MVQLKVLLSVCENQPAAGMSSGSTRTFSVAYSDLLPLLLRRQLVGQQQTFGWTEYKSRLICLFLLGMASVIEPLVKNLKCPVYCIQMPYAIEDSVTLKQLSEQSVQVRHKILKNIQ